MRDMYSGLCMTTNDGKAEHIGERASGVGQWHITVAASTLKLKLLPQSITAVGECDPGTATLSHGNHATYLPDVYIRICVTTISCIIKQSDPLSA